MTNTQTFEARLPNGDTVDVECKWCKHAEFYKGRVDGMSVYFERDGTQV